MMSTSGRPIEGTHGPPERTAGRHFGSHPLRRGERVDVLERFELRDAQPRGAQPSQLLTASVHSGHRPPGYPRTSHGRIGQANRPVPAVDGWAKAGVVSRGVERGELFGAQLRRVHTY